MLTKEKTLNYMRFLLLCVPLKFCSMQVVMVVLASSVLLAIICSLKSFIATSIPFTISRWIKPVRCLFISDTSISAVKIPFMLSSKGIEIMFSLLLVLSAFVYWIVHEILQNTIIQIMAYVNFKLYLLWNHYIYN